MLIVTRSAVVSGRLIDQFGDPITATISLRLIRGEVPAAYTLRTNARGEFRVGGVYSGTYELSAEQDPSEGDVRMSVSPDHEQTMAVLPVFYPGVFDRSAAVPVAVSTGIDISGLELTLRPQPVSTIVVEVESGGRALRNLSVQRYDMVPPGRTPTQATPSPDGKTWTIDSTAAGRYWLLASATDADGDEPPARTRLWASAEVASDGATPAHVKMTLAPGARVSGAVVYEGRAPGRPMCALRSLIPLDRGGTIVGAAAGRAVNGRSEFTIANVQPGRYFIQASEASGSWTVKSIAVDGRDVQGRPVEVAGGSLLSNVLVTMSEGITELSGTVTYDRTAYPRMAVLAFPADPQQWQSLSQLHLRGAEVDVEGRYVIRGLAPGEYRVAVVDSPASGPDLISMLKAIMPRSWSSR